MRNGKWLSSFCFAFQNQKVFRQKKIEIKYIFHRVKRLWGLVCKLARVTSPSSFEQPPLHHQSRPNRNRSCPNDSRTCSVLQQHEGVDDFRVPKSCCDQIILLCSLVSFCPGTRRGNQNFWLR